MKIYRITTIPGDGMGKDVIPAGQQVLQALAGRLGIFCLEFAHFGWGADGCRAHGRMMRADGLDALRTQDALLFGSADDRLRPAHARPGRAGHHSAGHAGRVRAPVRRAGALGVFRLTRRLSSGTLARSGRLPAPCDEMSPRLSGALLGHPCRNRPGMAALRRLGRVKQAVDRMEALSRQGVQVSTEAGRAPARGQEAGRGLTAARGRA